MGMTDCVLVHAGVGSPEKQKDGCEKATQAGLKELKKKTGTALKGAVAAAVVLEDDPRFNAGTGSNLRLDGKTIEMDGAVMDSEGRFASVAGIRAVRNPVRVAEKLLETPHHMLVGEGATRFARAHGFPEYDPVTDKAKERYEKLKKALSKQDGWSVHSLWEGTEYKSHWNFPSDVKKTAAAKDTIGAVCRTKKGEFAVASSTGGSASMLLGRVGDSPIIGSGFYAGEDGAVAATGIGEKIMEKMLARVVYDWIASGIPAQEACDWGIGLFPKKVPVGIIAVSHEGFGVGANDEMAWNIQEN